jgi:superfamily I DNA/RNA helicase
MQPSPQQREIYQWVQIGSGSAIVEAVAGSGKTTTLVGAVRLMRGRIATMAFNKKIASEIETKMAGIPGVKVGTVHSFGNQAWRAVVGGKGAKIDGKKTASLIEKTGMPFYLNSFVFKLVSLAKQRGLGIAGIPNTPEAMREIVDHFDLVDSLTGRASAVSESDMEARIAEGMAWASKVLDMSIATGRDVIDFDDMIYLPLVLDAKMPQYDWILVDEAQDTNPVRRMLIERMLAPGGRCIFVGDSRQAIYGFTGADADSMELIASTFNAQRLPLTVTYRCPKSVVEFSRQWVSHIDAAETAPAGVVRSIGMDEFQTLTAESLTASDAILCRNTAPLVALAFSLIRKRIPCHVEGRDIGAGLVALARRWKVSTIRALGDKLTGFVERETEKLMAKKQEMQAQQLADKVDTLRVIMGVLTPTASIDELVNEINGIFGDTEAGEPSPNLTLSTIHKSKGREWQRVYWLQRVKLQPSKYARQPWQLLQEDNLCYVAATRAMTELIEVN